MAWPTPNYYDYDKGVVLVLVLGNNILAAWSRVGVVVVVVVVWAVAVDVGLGRAVVDKELKVVGGAGGVAGDLDLELADERVLVDPVVVVVVVLVVVDQLCNVAFCLLLRLLMLWRQEGVGWTSR